MIDQQSRFLGSLKYVELLGAYLSQVLILPYVLNPSRDYTRDQNLKLRKIV